MRRLEVSSTQEPQRRGEILRAQLSEAILVRIEKLAFKQGTDPKELLEEALNLYERSHAQGQDKHAQQTKKDWGFSLKDLPGPYNDLIELDDLDGPAVSVQIANLRQHHHETPGDITSDFV